MNPDDLREILGIGDLVLYSVPGFCFEGTVAKINYDADLVTVKTTDFWGEETTYNCGMERISLLLKASALELKNVPLLQNVSQG